MCTTDKPFIIVVEVDNHRAFKAYNKGMNDLMLIWPQLMEAGEKADALVEEMRAKFAAEEAAAKTEYEAKKAQYDKDLARYAEEYRIWTSSHSLFRGVEPTRPIDAAHITYDLTWRMRRAMQRIPRGRGVKVYESIRDELQKMMNLAGAATGPYRMMEGQVHVMIEWENGHRIQQLLDHIKENS